MNTVLSTCLHWRLSQRCAQLATASWTRCGGLSSQRMVNLLNPHWCVVGTNMDRDIYESYSDVVRWTTVLILAAIRACYPVHDFQFDVSNAFQATRTDENPSESPKPLYYYQPPGFVVYM